MEFGKQIKAQSENELEGGFKPSYKETINNKGYVKGAPSASQEFTFHARASPKPPSSFSEKERNKDGEDDQPGFTFLALPKPLSSSSDVKQRIAETRTVDEEENEGMPRGRKELPRHMPPSHMLQVQPSTSSYSELELAQLLCCTCNILCTYPRGEKLVQCPNCMEVNHVMEAHEIGQVVCNFCSMLLMYRYGEPAVRCSSCHTVTDIGDHNRRAPLSEQQSQRRRRIKRHSQTR